MALGDRDYMKEAQRGHSPLNFEWADAVTLLLIANIGVFVLQHMLGVFTDHGRPWGMLTLPSLMEGRVWTIFTHMFVHEDGWHLLGNGMMIFMAGRSLESLVGQKKFLYIYFVSGLAGAAGQMIFEQLSGHDLALFGMYGASACAIGSFVALAAMLPREEVTAMIYFVIPVRMRLWTMATVLMGVSVVFGTLQFTGHGIDHIAHMAHLGGALMGWYMVRLYGYSGRPVTYDSLWRERSERDQKNRQLATVPRQKSRESKPDDNTMVPPLSTREFIEREIDPILDKIAAHGLGSLTDAERTILERARLEIMNRDEGS